LKPIRERLATGATIGLQRDWTPCYHGCAAYHPPKWLNTASSEVRSVAEQITHVNINFFFLHLNLGGGLGLNGGGGGGSGGAGSTGWHGGELLLAGSDELGDALATNLGDHSFQAFLIGSDTDVFKELSDIILT